MRHQAAVRWNRADKWAGGIGNGGFVDMSGTSTVARNSANRGGGIQNGSGVLLRGEASVRGNSSQTTGGGIDQTNSAILTLSGDAEIVLNVAGTDGGGVEVRASSVVAADGTTYPAWTGTITRNDPNQCAPAITLGTFTCDA